MGGLLLATLPPFCAVPAPAPLPGFWTLVQPVGWKGWFLFLFDIANLWVASPHSGFSAFTTRITKPLY